MMCGLFAFVGSSPRREMLDAVAAGAARRGPHAWGVAWVTSGGVEVRRGLGPMPKDVFDRCPDALMSSCVVGHCRLATCGAEDDLRAVQPLEIGNVVLAHNGVVRTGEDVSRLLTGNDSEVVAQWLGREPTAAGMDRALRETATGPCAAVAIIGGTLLVGRRGQPLMQISSSEGKYFCSRVPLGVDQSQIKVLSDNTTLTITIERPTR